MDDEPRFVWLLWYDTDPDDLYERNANLVGVFSTPDAALAWLEHARRFEPADKSWAIGDISAPSKHRTMWGLNEHWLLTRRRLDRPPPEDEVFATGAIAFGHALIDESPDDPESARALDRHRARRADVVQ